jgi:hypothetical protein
MADFYVDAGFPEHPKALVAGDEACWLYICGLAFCRRANTPGTIPKAVAARLVARNGARLAKRLCASDVGLWHDRGDHYEVHDYTVRNAKQLARTAKAKKAADVKWEQYHKQQSSTPPDVPEECPDDAPSTAPSSAQGIARTMPIYPENHRTNDPVQQQAAGTTEPAAAPMVDKALGILADRRVASHRGTLDNPAAYWRTTVNGLRKDLETEIGLVDWSQPWTPEVLADWLEPVPAKRPDPIDMTAAAQARRLAEADQEPCQTCGSRGRHGYVSTDAGAVFCPEATEVA